MPKITVIPQKINPLTHIDNLSLTKRKVAGYARVSTDSDEQFTSFKAQTDYYEKFIKANPEWEFVNVYTDEGISGTNTKKRDGFNQMIKDAKAGLIDLIVTKSVSRFARNTVDSLVTIRDLKDHGVECYFEKENIYTFDGKGELLITIMSSLAQEESRSISENVTWGQRKSFSDGKVHLAYSKFLGYEKGEDGKLKIVDSEAEVVRKIYSLFLNGETTTSIAKRLMEDGDKTPAGKERWRPATIESILTNEKYKGDALLQKRFTVNFLEHKMKKNEGEVEQYYVNNSHEAIIEPDEWDIVQLELKKRKEIGVRYSSKGIFSSRLKCECCGGYFGRKVWHSTDIYKTYLWQCNDKFKNITKCDTPHLKEDKIKEMFLKAYNQLMFNKEQVIEDSKLMIDALVDFEALEKEMQDEEKIINDLSIKVKELVDKNSKTPQEQDAYLKEYGELASNYKFHAEKLKSLKTEYEVRAQQVKTVKRTINQIKDSNVLLEEWNDKIWYLMVDEAIVHKDKSITFKFYNGIELKIKA